MDKGIDPHGFLSFCKRSAFLKGGSTAIEPDDG